MLRFGSRVGVAVSGGADSVFLLHCLAELGLAAAVVHVNHKLRGADSDADEAFVRKLAESLGVPIFVETAPVPEGNIEQEARRQRYRFFSRVLEGGAIDAVATGHTLEDQAETVMYRFLRGAGTAGLAGIRPVTESRTIRPLLDTSRAPIREFLLKRGFGWREDASNADGTYLRNRIRHAVLPVLEQIATPALPRILAGTAEWARAEEEYWRGEIVPLAESCCRFDGCAVILSVEAVQNVGVAVQRRLTRYVLELVRGDLRSIDFSHVEAARALILSAEGSGRLQIPGVDILRSFGAVRFSSLGGDSQLERNFRVPVEIPGETSLPDRRLSISFEPVTDKAVYNNQVNAVDRDLCAGNLHLRNWRPGDLFRCPGHVGPKKIKSLFQEFRIPLWERRSWPVITVQKSHHDSAIECNEAIVWTRQFGVAAEFAANSLSKNVFMVRDVLPQVTESKRIFSASIEVKRAPGFPSRVSGEPGAEVL